MTTKEQERKALEQIRKIVEGLGEDSYIGIAFEGCFEDAEANIENDLALSMYGRWQHAEQKIEQYKLDRYVSTDIDILKEIMTKPYAEREPLTDKEQRIFLAAMGREEKVCKEVDAETTREPYEDSLVKTCHEIIRKVKGALWTI